MRRFSVWKSQQETGQDHNGPPPFAGQVQADDEKSLIDLSKKGQREAFNLLVGRYERQVYNLSLRMLADPEAAADATQDAFFSAYSGLRGFKGGSFRAWLLRIATNACYDQLRSRKRHPSQSLEDLLFDPDHPIDFEDAAERPEEYALRQELGRTIQNGLLGLPPEQRVVLILSDVQGLSYEEIAEVTKSSLGTVKSRLSRGRAHLRDYLLQNRELLPGKYRP